MRKDRSSFLLLPILVFVVINAFFRILNINDAILDFFTFTHANLGGIYFLHIFFFVFGFYIHRALQQNIRSNIIPTSLWMHYGFYLMLSGFRIILNDPSWLENFSRIEIFNEESGKKEIILLGRKQGFPSGPGLSTQTVRNRSQTTPRLGIQAEATGAGTALSGKKKKYRSSPRKISNRPQQGRVIKTPRHKHR